MDRWYGTTWRGRPHYGTTLHAAAISGVKTLPSLLALAGDPALPAIVKASAATLAQPYVRAGDLGTVRKLLASSDPGVRIAALGMLERFEPAVRVQAAAALLADAVRGTRVEAARLLADVSDEQLLPDQRRAREDATTEYVDSLQEDADWPASNVNFGNLRMRQGRTRDAITAYERALALDARLTGAYVNLADAYRQLGQDADGEKVLRRGLALLPSAADLRHALGLTLVRSGDNATALQELDAAVKLAPDNARYAYVFAIGLHSGGKRDAALTVLREAEGRHPYDLDVLGALLSINLETGAGRTALPYARKIAEVLPDDPGVRRLVTELERSN
jgi:tetratricopeptide (TPR) repeat protein